ncbi:hypothetical protein [Paenibacillus sp. Root52]|uniref:hypothetical protein n=1 Tax=Paenibacillus sp. Root52 TaxID=1736552 RepID=UPI001F16ECFC|nr:hypothetical protein [Paenibacillus sp. Root52]
MKLYIIIYYESLCNKAQGIAIQDGICEVVSSIYYYTKPPIGNQWGAQCTYTL